MLRNAITATAALALTLAPIAAQAAPRAATPVEQTDELDERRGVGIYIIGAVVLGLIIWGIIELTSDDESESP